jgi:Alpha/beta hydrolase domain
MTGRKSLLSLLCFALFICMGWPKSVVASATSCLPRLQGPIAITLESKIISHFPLPAGVIEDEYVISCSVTSGQYRTLINVRRPSTWDPRTGVIIVEPWHPGGGWSYSSNIRDYAFSAGNAIVVVAGDPLLVSARIIPSNPLRYSGLFVPGQGSRVDNGNGSFTVVTTDEELEILAQVGPLLRSGAVAGLIPRKILLAGMSQSGEVIQKYLDKVSAGELPRVYDGYLPSQCCYKRLLAAAHAPLILLNSENELMHSLAGSPGPIRYRAPDSAQMRIYEVPGMPHAKSVAPAYCKDHLAGNFGDSAPAIYAAVLTNMTTWLIQHKSPPRAAPIAVTAQGDIARDRFGNALGGYRSTNVDVPIATYHAFWGPYTEPPRNDREVNNQRCGLYGWIEPFDRTLLQQLYSSHGAYVNQVDAVVAALLRQGFLETRGARQLEAEARLASVP